MSELEPLADIAVGMDMRLTPVDREVAWLICQHRGASRAITIAEIARTLWPEEWNDIAQRSMLQRVIKAGVRRLRRAGWKIGSRRGENPGFFIIQNSRELAETVRPLFNQAIDQLRTIEALTGKNYYARELAGQMRLFGREL